jgi:hypothetical protein
MKNENAHFDAMKDITQMLPSFFLTGAAGPTDDTGIWYSTEEVDKHEHDHQV